MTQVTGRTGNVTVTPRRDEPVGATKETPPVETPATGWKPGANATGARAVTTEPTAAPPVPPGLDDATRSLVKATTAQLKTVNGQLVALYPKLNEAKAQLEADKKAVPMSESLNPFGRGAHEKKVDESTAKVNQLQGQVDGLSAQVSGLNAKITGAITTALQADPDFQTRGAQLKTLGQAQAATTRLLGTIDDTKKSLKAASTAISTDSIADAFADNKDPTSNALGQSREMNKAAAIATANAKFAVLPSAIQAWQSQVQALTNENVATGDTGKLRVSINTLAPLTRELLGDQLADSMASTENISNSIAIGTAIGKVDMLRGQVAAYGDQLASKAGTLQTSQNNQIVATRQQLLK